MPQPCFMSFAFGMHRNLVCLNANEFVRQQIEARVTWFDVIDERNAVRLMFNAHCSGGCGNRPYTYDGTTYASGWLDEDDAGPWINVITDPDLQWTLCSEGPMCAIEQLFEDQRDPYNCFPLDCGNGFDVVLTRDCKKYPFQEVLGGRSFEAAISGACCMGATSPRGAREGWNRTAHEALLAGTPVVGVRAGGLGELLGGAGQLTVEDATSLAVAVAEALDRRAELAARGRAFARAFTRERFAAAWTALIEEEARAAHA